MLLFCLSSFVFLCNLRRIWLINFLQQKQIQFWSGRLSVIEHQIRNMNKLLLLVVIAKTKIGIQIMHILTWNCYWRNCYNLSPLRPLMWPLTGMPFLYLKSHSFSLCNWRQLTLSMGQLLRIGEKLPSRIQMQLRLQNQTLQCMIGNVPTVTWKEEMLGINGY